MNNEASIAWVGVGRMGSVMIDRLLEAGRAVSIWNRTKSKTTQLAEKGADVLDELSEAAEHDVVISMVLDDTALAALHAPGGLLSNNPKMSVWIDCSTVSIGAAQWAAKAASEAGISYVSAPISGNPEAVKAGTSVLAISGDDPVALDIAEDIGLDICRAVHRVGSGSAANVVKLCVNALLSVTAQSLVEVVVLANKMGVSRAQLMEFINDSAIGSGLTRSKTRNLVEMSFQPTFTPEGQRKDVRLALEEANKVEMPMPLLSATETEFSRLIGSGVGADKDYISLILQVARDAGVTLQPESR